jgi:primosomal protein N'
MFLCKRCSGQLAYLTEQTGEDLYVCMDCGQTQPRPPAHCDQCGGEATIIMPVTHAVESTAYCEPCAEEMGYV